MSDCRSLYRAATLLHGQPSFCRQYSFASALLCSSIYAGRQSERDQTPLRSPIAQRWRGVDPTSDTLPFGGLWYAGPDDCPCKSRERQDDALGVAAVCSEIGAIFSRRLANDPSEGTIERRHRLESGFRCHFAHAAPGVTQQHARIFDPAPGYVIAKLQAGSFGGTACRNETYWRRQPSPLS
jgi:hypothetical protein